MDTQPRNSFPNRGTRSPSRDETRGLETAANQLGVEAISADMGNLQEIAQLAAHFDESGLDVLVNNAAIARFQPLDTVTPADFDEIFSINVRGPLMLIQGLLSALEKRHGCVNAVAPGAIDTPISSKIGLSPEQLQTMRRIQETNIPMGRYGEPDEVAKVILAIVESCYVTGAIWRVDGGVTA